MLENKRLFILIETIAVIINTLLIIGFMIIYSNRCGYKELIEKIKTESKDGNIRDYTDVFCQYKKNEDNLFFYFNLFDVAYILSNIFALIIFIVSTLKRIKSGLICSIIFFFGPTIISIFNIFMAAFSSSSLKSISSNFSDQLKEEIEDAYISVKGTKTFLIIFTIFSLFITIFCGIMNIILLYRIHKEDNYTLMENLVKSSDNRNGINNDNGLKLPQFNINPPDLQENLYVPE
jgi:hypothetical protein